MTDKKPIRTLPATLLFFVMLACLINNPAGSVIAADKKLNISNLKVLGLVIGDCTTQEIYSRLGPTIPVRDDGIQLCYVSDRDETLIVFSTESAECTGFKMMSQKKRYYKWHFCEQSLLVSKYMTSENGIKLGMTRSRLKSILGIPQKETGQNLIYVYPSNLKIKAEFSETGMILFDVSKY